MGIGSADKNGMKVPENLRPGAIMKNARSVVVIGVPIPRGMVKTI